MRQTMENFNEKLNNQEECNNEDAEKAPEFELFEEDKPEDISQLSIVEIWPQIWTAVLANSISILAGINAGFSTVFITQLMADPNIKEFTKTEGSWIASLTVLSSPIGSLCIGPIMDKIGRKKAIIFANTLPIVCWGMTYSVSDSIWPLYIGRIIGGAGAAMMATVDVYVSEICQPRVRDVMLILVGAFVSLGTLITMVLGSYMEWHQATLCFTILAGISLMASFFLPESPLWLVSFRPSQKRVNKALALTKYFNRSQKLSEQENERLLDIYAKIKKSTSILAKKTPLRKWLMGNINIFRDRTVYKPTVILLTVFSLWASSGVFTILLYSTNVFQAIGSQFGAGFDEYSATITLGVVKLVMTLVSAVLSLRVGRRTLMFISSLGMAVTITSAAICQSFSDNKLNFSKTTVTNTTSIISETESNVTSALTVISLVLFVMMGSLAMTAVPWALLTELLPTRARALGNSLIASYASLALFIVLKSTPLIIDLFSLSTLFFIFGAVSLLSAIYIHFKLPETLGRNLQEIEKYFE